MFDLTLPNYKYLGPFNSLHKGEPNNFNDAVALLHDKGYDKLIKIYGEYKIYLVWNAADFQASSRWTDDDYGGFIAKRFFIFKKALTDHRVIQQLAGFSEHDLEVLKEFQTMPTFKGSKDNPWTQKQREENGYDDNGNRRDDMDTSRERSGNTISPQQPNQKRKRTTGPTLPDAGTSNDVEMARGEGGGPKHRGHETGLDPFNNVRYGMPKSTTQFHTYQAGFSFITPGAGQVAVLRIRLNSLYDIITNVGTYALSTANAISDTATIGIKTDTGDGAKLIGLNQPSWRRFFSDIYKYYHVIGCKWKLTLHNQETESTNIACVYTHRHGSDYPPIDNISVAEMLYWQNMSKLEYLYPTNESYPNNVKVLKGQYQTGEHYGIVDDLTAAIWTPAGKDAGAGGANPTQQEYLSIFVGHAPISGGGSLTVRAHLQMSFICQWKDLQIKYQYPLDFVGADVPAENKYENIDFQPIGDVMFGNANIRHD